MMNDDTKFDDLLRIAAQDYNRPPAAVPRDSMWQAIEKARAERALRPLHIVPAAPQRRIRRYTWVGAAAAAVLLVATGVGIGRWSTLRESSPPPRGKSPAVASDIAAPTSASESGGNQVAGVGSNGTGTELGNVGVNPESGTPGSRMERSSQSGSAAPRRAGARIVATPNRLAGTLPSGASRTSDRIPGQQVPYQVATIRHLANAEALLTAFRSDSRDAKMDAQLSKWARDLLANTRLLLDSPAADDPQRARLLGDLELVLAEIVQLSPGAGAQDRDLIEGSIRTGHVITRLRSAIPAGPTRGL